MITSPDQLLQMLGAFTIGASLGALVWLLLLRFAQRVAQSRSDAFAAALR